MFKKGLLLIIVLITLGSCSKLTKALKISDPKERYKVGMKFYDNKDYYRASVVFEDLIPVFRGKLEAEKLQFYYAYTYFHQKQYSLSAHYFQSFSRTYGRSELVEEASYMYVKSLYQSSPDFNLDQSNSDQTVTAAQDYLNLYPKTKFLAELSLMIQTLREKQEFKAYNIAKQYHKLRRYKSAFVMYDNFQKDFPDSQYREEITFNRIEAQYEIFKLSVASKRQERVEKVMTAYYYFIDKYPKSVHLKDAEVIFAACQKAILKDKNLAKADS